MILAYHPAGHKPLEESATYALAARANELERKLLGLHCGQMLERSRHLEWARSRMATTRLRQAVIQGRAVHWMETA